MRVTCLGLRVYGIASCQHGRGDAVVTLRRRNEFQAAVLVLMVVPTHELLRPSTRSVEARERVARVVGPLLAGAEQRLGVRIVVTLTCPLR